MSNPILDAIGKTPRDLIWNIVNNMFIIDLGVVQAVNGTSTVDVQHAIQPQRSGKQLPSTITHAVEILWTMPGIWDLAIGDVVLLVGLKDYVKTANGATPGTTDIPLHYRQETMKAIPIFANGKTVKINGGGSAAARQNDAIIANATTDPTFFTFLATVATFMGAPGTAPTSLTGKINAGSSNTQIGG